MHSLPNRARIVLVLANVNTTSRRLVSQARVVLHSSRETARLARTRITGSHQRLSQAGDTIVAAASHITAARSAMRANQGT